MLELCITPWPVACPSQARPGLPQPHLRRSIFNPPTSPALAPSRVSLHEPPILSHKSPRRWSRNRDFDPRRRTPATHRRATWWCDPRCASASEAFVPTRLIQRRLCGPPPPPPRSSLCRPHRCDPSASMPLLLSSSSSSCSRSASPSSTLIRSCRHPRGTALIDADPVYTTLPEHVVVGSYQAPHPRTSSSTRSGMHRALPTQMRSSTYRPNPAPTGSVHPPCDQLGSLLTVFDLATHAPLSTQLRYCN
jgi:hypothetical protein